MLSSITGPDLPMLSRMAVKQEVADWRTLSSVEQVSSASISNLSHCLTQSHLHFGTVCVFPPQSFLSDVGKANLEVFYFPSS
jgi:hypothetical protein